MTVTKDISLLSLFKTKIDEAASYVPRMQAADKVKAVQFWNLVSEKLQDVVNSSSADINSATEKFKATENEFEKMHMHMNNSRPVNVVSNCNISSDFINLPSSYGMNNEIIEQYSVGIDNTQLLTSETFSIVPSLNNINSMSQFNPLNSSMNSCERNITDNYIAIDNLSENNCETLALNSCMSTSSRNIESVLEEESIKNNDYISKEVAHNETNLYKPSEVTEEDSNNSYNLNNTPLTSHNPIIMKVEASDKKDNKFSVLKLSLLKDKESSKFTSQNDNDDHENNVSDDNESTKSGFDTTMSVGDSDSERAEHIEPIVSFVVSSSEEILAKNDLSPEAELDEKCPDNCNERKCLHLKRYRCTECPAKFASRANLVVHMRTHTGEKPYSCSKCSSSFTTKGNLKRHLKTHTGEKPFECTHCGSKFTENKSLKVHMRRHTGEKPYECKECGKRFAQSGILNSHMAMHLNLKFHLCEHCGKSFRQKSQLQIHRLRHENIRKHDCSICSSKFLTKGDLERHMRTHTGERPFVCDLCSKAFTRQQSLNEHMNRHYGIRPYLCKYCNRNFTEMSACYKHVKQHEKAAAEGSENSQTESETSKLSEESSHDISHSSSLEILGLKSDLSKPDSNELPSKDETISSYIENYIV